MQIYSLPIKKSVYISFDDPISISDFNNIAVILEMVGDAADYVRGI